MFARYRRTPPSSANGSLHKRRGGKTNNQDPVAALLELRIALNRLDELTESFQGLGVVLLSDLDAANEKRVNEDEDASKNNANNAVIDVTGKKALEGTEQADISKQFGRSPSALASDLLLATNAHFLSIPIKEEEEFIELIRRIAELVVLSERMAGQILEDVSKKGSVDRESAEDNNEEESDENSINSEDAMPYIALFELFCERNTLENVVKIVTGVAFNPKEKQQSRNSSTNSLDEKVSQAVPEKAQSPHILPPLTIATQAIQSISILIQNVSRATSLYLLLSNNRVNDLIGLPLHLYKRAEMNHAHYLRFAKRGSKRPTMYTGLPLPVPPTVQSLNSYTSNEIGELTTHFVSFLKSLAMRVNTETLQFFLAFSVVKESNVHDDPKAVLEKANEGYAVSPDANVLGEENGEHDVFPMDSESAYNNINTMSDQIVPNLIQSESKVDHSVAEYPKEDGVASVKDSDVGSSIPSAPDNCTLDVPNQRNRLKRQPIVNFPLYARALEFCSSEQDSFVRVTAMNMCMNMIRLATLHGHHEIAMDEIDRQLNLADNESKIDDTEQQKTTSLPMLAPSGVLHEAPSLTKRDRIAIAQYSCDPGRISDLVSPLCARLTSQFGQIEGAVRNLQQIANASIPKHLQQSKAERKSRLTNTVRDQVANLQDDLLMFDDLLDVGLVSLNEQAIEMLLATFIYPMLLQPLLLPLHRCSSATIEGQHKNNSSSLASANQNLINDSKVVVSTQSPPPSPKKKIDSTNVDVSNNVDDVPSAIYTQFSSSQNDVTKCYSSEDMDLAPSKTALFGISIVFHSISNPCLKHLLLTALLHPFSPPASGGAVIQIPPQVTFSSSYSNDSSGIIRMEKNHLMQSISGISVPVYNFGIDRRQYTTENYGEKLCTFILAPALIDMLAKLSDSNIDVGSSSKRANPYRKIILSYLTGSDEMVALQKLATVALYDIVSGVDVRIIREVSLRLNASNQKSESVSDDSRVFSEDRLLGTLDFVCQSIINKSITLDGWWKVSFNGVAAKTLLIMISNDSRCISFAYNAITKLRLETASFLLSLPSRLDEKSRESSNKNNENPNSVDKQHLETWLLDRFYFDQPNKSTSSVVEHVRNLGVDRFGMEVLSTHSLNDASELLCEDTRVIDNQLVSETKGNTPFHCAATWASASLSLDAFCIKLAEMKAATENDPRETVTRTISTSDSSSLTTDSIVNLSEKLTLALQDKSDSEDSSKKNIVAPEYGSSVGLVGKAAFPCVCEVTSSFASLFTGRTCVSNEGVQWQSLYLVVIGTFAVLVEPERGRSGGEGKVITTCKLACLSVKKDTTVLTNNNTPARRLLLQYSTLDQEPPPLFTRESTSSSDKLLSMEPDRLCLSRSRLDLWFEDSNACSVAWKALAGKVAKARAKRGSKIRSALLASQLCPPQAGDETEASF